MPQTPDEHHWDRVYDTKSADAVSWYTPHLTRSLELIAEAALPPDAHIIDVGGVYCLCRRKDVQVEP